MREGDGIGRENLPVVLQSRHRPSDAVGAGGRVDAVVCDAAHALPAEVDVGGLVDEEEGVEGLCLKRKGLRVSFFASSSPVLDWFFFFGWVWDVVCVGFS
jgi:hypothetical protein